MKKWNGRELNYERTERKEMGIYEERLQDISFYGEGDSKVSSGGSCRMRCSRLSVLSEPTSTAVYVAGTGDFSENPEMFLFFMWILGKYPTMFVSEYISVLARLFGRSEEELKACSIEDSTLQTLKQILLRFISQTPNSTDICKKALNNNKTKIRLLQQFLSQ